MRRASLPDGSTVTLNTASRIVVDFKPAARTVKLAEGEALFSVHHDPARPFVVEAGAVSVRAARAEFSIRRREGREVEVMVCDGFVDLLREGRVVQRISAGRVVSAAPAKTLATQAVTPDEVGRRLAWREGMVAFHGETLAQAADEFARYADERIVIDDPMVARRTVVGLFVANDPINFAQAVAGSFGLRAERVPGGVRLTEASPA
jgi:transmembrane sensor